VAGFVVLSALLVGSFWAVPYLPTNDGPESVFAVHMENHFADPGTLYREVFEPAPQFAGRGFTVLFEPLEELFGWRRGLQVALSLMALLHAWGGVALVHAVDRRRVPLAFACFPLSLSWTLYMGFFAFVIASGAALLVLAFALRDLSPRPGRRAVVAALLLGVAFLHMFPAILVGLTLAAAQLARAPRGTRLAEFGRTALTGLPAAALVVAAFVVAHGAAVTAAFSSGFVMAPWREAIATFPRTLAPGPVPRALATTGLVTLVAASALVRGVIARRGASTLDRALGLVGVAFLAAAIVSPRHIPGWQCFSERFVAMGAVFVIASLPFEVQQARPTARLGALLAFVAAVLALGPTWAFHRRLAADVADAIAGLDAPVVRHGIWLPVDLDPRAGVRATDEDVDVPLMDPLHAVGPLYATALGGITPYTFASNPATWAFTLRPDGLRPPEAPALERWQPLLASSEFRNNRDFRLHEEGELATFGMFFEGVLVTQARPEDLDLWQRRGYVTEWQQGSVLLAHFEPCSIDLVLAPETAVWPAPSVDVGVGRRTLVQGASFPVSHDSEGAGHVAIERGPCGRVWVRPRWAADDGRPRGCDGANAKGELHVTISRTEHAAVCRSQRLDASP
jgi:hypothetical protein